MVNIKTTISYLIDTLNDHLIQKDCMRREKWRLIGYSDFGLSKRSKMVQSNDQNQNHYILLNRHLK